MLPNPLVCNYYVTLRCNDTCEFCEIWQNEQFKQVEEAPLQDISKNLVDLKKIGVRYIDFTGGEPLLRHDLPQILKAAKELGFFNVLTTNGILLQDRLHEISKYVDILLFSLDSPVENEHDRIRGVGCYEQAIKGIKLAKKHVKNALINFTLTRDSVLFLPEMVDLANSLNILVWINPVYNYKGVEGFKEESLEYIKRYKNNRNIAFNFASLDLIKHGGNNTSDPACKAVNSTITILPDNTLVMPCFYKQDFSVRIDGKLIELYRAKKGIYKSKQGKFNECNGCLAWPYMNPSFIYKFSKRLPMSLYSIGKFLLKINTKGR